MNQQSAFDFTAPPPAPPTGAQLRDAGIARAVDHAEAQVPEWGELAFAAVRRYALAHDRFTAEDVREDAYAQGLAKPPNEKAWGGPFQRAAKAGIVRPDGVEPARDPKCHRGYKMRWASVLRNAG